MTGPGEDGWQRRARDDGQVGRSPLVVETVRSETSTTVVVSGDLDVATAPLLRDELAVSDGGSVDLDLSALEFIDASGVGTLAHASARYRDDGVHFRVLRPRPFVQRILTICELDHLIEPRDGNRRSQRADST